MSPALSFIGGTGSIGFCEMLLVLKKSFPFWLAFNVQSNSIPFHSFPAHLLRSKLAPLTGSLYALMRSNLNSNTNVIGTQIG
jgi:hypothetical protein